MIYTFYSLSDPITNEVRYIGVTTLDAKQRFAQHKCSALRRMEDQTHKTKWFRSLLKKGLVPILSILKVYECSDSSWESIEQELITSYPNLTNHHPGGQGIVKGNRNTVNKCKKVVKIHPWRDEILAEFNSAKEAEIFEFKTNTGVINQCVRGKHKHSNGFRWSYANPLVFPDKLPYLFLYSGNQLIKSYPSKNDLRKDMTWIFDNFETFTITKNIPTISPLYGE